MDLILALYLSMDFKQRSKKKHDCFDRNKSRYILWISLAVQIGICICLVLLYISANKKYSAPAAVKDDPSTVSTTAAVHLCYYIKRDMYTRTVARIVLWYFGACCHRLRMEG